jgi:hypothetical protein
MPLSKLSVRWFQLPALVLAVVLGTTGGIALSADNPGSIGDVFEGEPLTLRAEVEGGQAPFHYLWFKDYIPISGATNPELRFEAMSRSDSGTYWVTVFNDSGSATSPPEVITVGPGKPSRLGNVSIVSSAQERVVVGFTLGGAGTSGTTEILARAAGPSLAQLGVSGGLQDPVLSLFRQGQLLSTNDDWGDNVALSAAAVKVGAFPFSAASRDSAVLLALTPSGYTAEVVDSGSGVGVTVIELYDTRPAPVDRARPRLINISARGVAGGDGIPLTAGFTIQGGASVTVLLRGVGPSLGKFGITDVVADPSLTLFQGDTIVSANDNWGQTAPTVTAAQTKVGAFTLTAGSLDAALVVALRPGSYSAQVSGANAGFALIEVYEVP